MADGRGWWYNPQSWSIAVEFRCSMVLFLLILATIRSRPTIRILIDATFATQCMLMWRWDVSLFIVGKLLAELEAIKAGNEERQEQLLHEEEPAKHPYRWMKSSGRRGCALVYKLGLVICLLLGCYLAGYSASPPKHSRFHSPLSSLVYHDAEGRRIYYALAANLMLGCITFMPILRGVFNCSIARYLGRISYALYLVHGPLIRVVGSRLLRWSWGITGMDGWWSFNLGFGLTSILFTPIVVWAADVFERAVDAKTVKFAKWIETWTM